MSVGEIMWVNCKSVLQRLSFPLRSQPYTDLVKSSVRIPLYSSSQELKPTLVSPCRMLLSQAGVDCLPRVAATC